MTVILELQMTQTLTKSKNQVLFTVCVGLLLGACGQEPATVGMMQCNDLRLTLEELRVLRPEIEKEIETKKSPITQETGDTIPDSDLMKQYEAKAQQVINLVSNPGANKGECSMGDYKTSVQVPQKPEIEGHLKRFRAMREHGLKVREQHQLIEDLREINPEFVM